MTLAPLEMSVAAADGLVLKGTLTYPVNYAGAAFPLAVLAHQYPATRDSYAPLAADLLESGIATLAFDERGQRLKTPVYLASSCEDPFDGGANVHAWSRNLSHVTARIVPGSAHGMAIYFDLRDELLRFLRQSLGVQ